MGSVALLQMPGIVGSDGAGAASQPSFTFPTFTFPVSARPSQGGSSGGGGSTGRQTTAQKITFTSNPPTNPKVGGTYTVSARGGGSGNPVTFSIDPSSSSGACSINRSTVSFSGAGTCVIDANQAAKASYSAAPQVQQSVTVAGTSQTITFTSNPPTNPNVGGTYAVSATGGGSGNPVTFSIDPSSSSGACSITGSTVSFSGAGTCVIDANQAAKASYSAAPQVQQSLVIAASSASPSAGGSAGGFSQMTPGTWTMGQNYGGWVPVFNGYGSIGVTADPGVGNVLQLSPEVSTAPSETHSALVTSAATQGDLNFSVQVQTVRQLRQGSAPNPWEVGWAFWHYTDNTHFYYFILKPNGWELGKEDPSYTGNQRFLATGSSPALAIGSWHTIDVQQVGATMTVSVDGNPVVTFTDTQNPYTSGSVGLYCEDSVVNFANPSISPLS